jgi:hypothetical protein
LVRGGLDIQAMRHVDDGVLNSENTIREPLVGWTTPTSSPPLSVHTWYEGSPTDARGRGEQSTRGDGLFGVWHDGTWIRD